MNKFIVFVFYFVWICSLCNAQVNWVKHNQNPVLTASNSLYERFIGGPSVIKDNGIFKMYYAATGADGKGRIMMATSTDGVSWVKRAQPVLDVNPVAGSWDGYFLDCPEVIKDASGYKMYYFAQPGDDPLQSAIGIATSSDGVTWARYSSNPILIRGNNSSDIDHFYIESPTVTYMGGKYYMLYTAVDASYLNRVGMAVSNDGFNWTKQANNPIVDVLSPTLLNAYIWDGGLAGMPSLNSRNGKLEAWYNGVSCYTKYVQPDETAIHIGYLSSDNMGLSWSKYANNPVLSTTSPPFTEFERRGPMACDVLYDEDDHTYKMWYETAYGFGMATSTDTSVLSIGSSSVPAEMKISVYPNPVNDQLTVKFSKPVTNFTIGIIDNSGKLVKTEKNNQQINVSGLKTGVYLIKISYDNKTQVEKFIKK